MWRLSQHKEQECEKRKWKHWHHVVFSFTFVTSETIIVEVPVLSIACEYCASHAMEQVLINTVMRASSSLASWLCGKEKNCMWCDDSGWVHSMGVMWNAKNCRIPLQNQNLTLSLTVHPFHIYFTHFVFHQSSLDNTASVMWWSVSVDLLPVLGGLKTPHLEVWRLSHKGPKSSM